MSSGTTVNMNATRELLQGVTSDIDSELEKVGRLGLSPRQQELNRYWSYYRCQQYESRAVDWDGSAAKTHLERDMIGQAGFIPPGYVDYSGETLPVSFRKPSAPYHLAKVVVDRFTGLLFSQKRRPAIQVEGDEDTEEWLKAFAQATRLWSKMRMVRNFGGGTGTACFGFKFVRGNPTVEVHDPRWCTPDFVDKNEHVLRRLEIRYIFHEEIRNPQTGVWEEMPFWYRRVIDQEIDMVWPRVPVNQGEEPVWARHEFTKVEHNLGFCPVVWVQNQPELNEIDGLPDAYGIFELCEVIDGLYSQANTGALANCDPTVVVATDKKLSEIKKGSRNAIKVGKGESANYLEISGMGAKTAVELAKELEVKAREVVRCIEDNLAADGAQRTATEIERRYSSMLEQADILREQYGDLGVIRLLEMVLRAARLLSNVSMVVEDEEGQTKLQTTVIHLPPRITKDEETGEVTSDPQTLGAATRVQLKWPRYFEPNSTDVQLAVGAAGAAKEFTLIDQEHASKFVAPFFGVEDVNAMVERLEEKVGAEQAELAENFLNDLNNQGRPDTNARPPRLVGAQGA